MIVDCHTHLPKVVEQTGGASELLASAEMIDACIVLAHAGENSEEVNKKLLGYVSSYRDKLLGFAYINPICDAITPKALSNLIEKNNFKGFVVYCCEDKFHPAHSRAMRFYAAAQELEVPVFFDNCQPLSSSAVLDYAQSYLLDEIARKYPELKMVIGSMGRPFVNQTIAMLAKHENVYADLTIKPDNIWQIYNIVVSANESDVMDKLLFGSGYPAGSAGPCIETLLGFNKLLADTSLPTVPRGSIRNIVERDSLEVLGINI
ncbi:MAG: amidohydrolase family protein [Planctomycetes bacterium]|nr:amidohydrolase family protein [Planctomycetota bacterium]